jgi:hypothetical protein
LSNSHEHAKVENMTTHPDNGLEYRVLADYEVNEPHPLVLHEAVAVEIIRKDAGWPGWVWVRAGDGDGWVPESYLDGSRCGPALTTRAFNGADLSARQGEILTAIESACGWILARNSSGQSGWFPLFNLRPVQRT